LKRQDSKQPIRPLQEDMIVDVCYSHAFESHQIYQPTLGLADVYAALGFKKILDDETKEAEAAKLLFPPQPWKY
jgi:hypothetical protein